MLLSVLAWTANTASAFSLLGPYDTTWQIERIGLATSVNGAVGGPMNLGEEYRWNIRTITYGFDPSFRNYFGERGMQEVRKAVAILNALPPVSKMSTNLEEFPLDTRRYNSTANALGILDLKSHALAALIEQMGLTAPERFVWQLHDRVEVAPIVNYWVVMRNFEPVPGSISNYRPSKFVNGTLYTYSIFEFVNPDFAEAIEYPVDPASPTASTVAGVMGAFSAGFLNYGEFFSGLTRDDIAGLRYLYRPGNYNIENLVFSNNVTSGGVPWSPVGGGSNFVNTALRPGVDKITFVEGKYESEFGNYISTINTYSDLYVTNNHLIKQSLRTALPLPDIIFGARDMYNFVPPSPLERTGAWQNNAGIHGQNVSLNIVGGPGVCIPSQVINFNKIGPALINITEVNSRAFLTEEDAFSTFVWGSFDGTTNPPVIYPEGSSLEALEQQVLGN